MRRTSVATVLLAAIMGLVGSAWAKGPEVPADPPSRLSWALAEINAVVETGALGPSVAHFRAEAPITRGELAGALAALGKRSWQPRDPSRIVSMRELNARLVVAAGLRPVARSMRRAAVKAGLSPTGMLGTETVARLLGLRVNHPQGEEELERGPRQAATRAEAAYSLARLQALSPGQIEYVRELAADFRFPTLGRWQRTVLSRALRFVGHPYVWAGSSEKRQELYYGAAPGGFDCSGFVWRVYKLEPFVDAPLLGEMLRGRTTFSMSAEVKKGSRVSAKRLQPADLVFFGSSGAKSIPAQMGHMGIYVGNGWFVHSSSNGVTLQPVQGWYAERLAWGRRPLAEAGLSAPRA